jgi:hypothetical protein
LRSAWRLNRVTHCQKGFDGLHGGLAVVVPLCFLEFLIGDEIRMFFLPIVTMRAEAPSVGEPQAGPIFVSVPGEYLTQSGDFGSEDHTRGVDWPRFVFQRFVPLIGWSFHILNYGEMRGYFVGLFVMR